MGFRLGTVAFLIFLAYSFLLFHLYGLQLEQGLYYQKKADAQYLASGVLEARRGYIYFTDKSGQKIAVAGEKDFPLIYAIPKIIENSTTTAQKLALILNKPVGDLRKVLSNKKSTYALLQRKADQATADRVTNLNIKGVVISTVASRYYPFNSFASQLIGFVSPNSDDGIESGRYGVEKYYNDTLFGQTGKASGTQIMEATPGADVTLTLDPNIQHEAEHAIDSLVIDYKALGASAIVMDPNTGKILALANTPSFNPNNYQDANIADFLNPATQQIYEPGSVFKVLTMSAGIDAGKITPQTTYYDTGKLTLNGRTIKNDDYDKHGPYGTITMTNVIEHSLNVGAAFAEQKTGNGIFTAYLKKFGLDEKTGVTLPGELAGDLHQLNPKARQIAFATASYGQGVAVTPLQVITAISAIANGGKLMRPYVDASLNPEVRRQVISADTARKVTQMMVSAVDVANVTKISGYSVAGKTGTAYVPDFKKGGYTDNVINTYVGFGPATNPKFIVLLKLNEPAGAPFAALTVVPAFRELAQFILNYYNIPPDRL